MFLLNNLSSNRFLFFIYLLFVYFFIYRSFHSITEEVCVSLCVIGFLGLLLYYMTGKGLETFQKIWYKRFLENIDIVLLSLTTLHRIFSYIFTEKSANNFNLLDFYIYFLNIFTKNISCYYFFIETGLNLFHNKIFTIKDKKILGSKHMNNKMLCELLD